MVIEDFDYRETTKVKIATNIFVKKRGSDKTNLMKKAEENHAPEHTSFLSDLRLSGVTALLRNFHRTKGGVGQAFETCVSSSTAHQSR